MQVFNFLDDLIFEEDGIIEKNREIKPEVFNKLPEDMIVLILFYSGKNGMSTCKKMRQIYFKTGVNIRSPAYIDKPNHEGLYLLLRYAKSIDYDCFSILSQSAVIDLPNLQVLKITEKTDNSIKTYNLKWVRMPKIKRIIFRTKTPYYQKMFSIPKSVYFSRLIQTINNSCYIDAELEYHGMMFEKEMRYRKVIVTQSLLKNFSNNLINHNKIYNNKDIIIKSLAIFIRDFRVFDNLEDREIEVLRNFIGRVKLFNDRDRCESIDKIPDFYERYIHIFPNLRISVNAILKDIEELEKKYTIPDTIRINLFKFGYFENLSALDFTENPDT